MIFSNKSRFIELLKKGYLEKDIDYYLFSRINFDELGIKKTNKLENICQEISSNFINHFPNKKIIPESKSIYKELDKKIINDVLLLKTDIFNYRKNEFSKLIQLDESIANKEKIIQNYNYDNSIVDDLKNIEVNILNKYFKQKQKELIPLFITTVHIKNKLEQYFSRKNNNSNNVLNKQINNYIQKYITEIEGENLFQILISMPDQYARDIFERKYKKNPKEMKDFFNKNYEMIIASCYFDVFLDETKKYELDNDVRELNIAKGTVFKISFSKESEGLIEKQEKMTHQKNQKALMIYNTVREKINKEIEKYIK